jgi:type II secretion system protein G
MKQSKISGFSLIELLVVISLIAILLSVSLVASDNARKSGRDSKRKADLEQIRSALEIYRNDCRAYPSNDKVVSGDSLTGTEQSGSVCLEDTDIYMESIPADPLPGRKYHYLQSTSNPTNQYVICASLENGGDDVVSGCTSADCGEVCNYKVTNP